MSYTNLYATKWKCNEPILTYSLPNLNYETILSMCHSLVVVMSPLAVQGSLAFT